VVKLYHARTSSRETDLSWSTPHRIVVSICTVPCTGSNAGPRPQHAQRIVLHEILPAIAFLSGELVWCMDLSRSAVYCNARRWNVFLANFSAKNCPNQPQPNLSGTYSPDWKLGLSLLLPKHCARAAYSGHRLVRPFIRGICSVPRLADARLATRRAAPGAMTTHLLPLRRAPSDSSAQTRYTAGDGAWIQMILFSTKYDCVAVFWLDTSGCVSEFRWRGGNSESHW